MNQILETKEKNQDLSNFSFHNRRQKNNQQFFKKLFLYRIQFIFSLILVFSFGTIFILYKNSLNHKENLSDTLLNNYQIYRLYADSSENTLKNDASSSGNSLFGTIQIPSINLYYPVFSYLTEDLLKIAPCKFYGSTLEENSNICIAGHNYDNNLFFSNLSKLNYNNEIIFYDIAGKAYKYNVFDKYEVKETDLSPIFDYNPNIKQLTLITCNNLSHNRIIIKAKQ